MQQVESAPLMSISCGLPEGKHRKKMGTAIWLFLWLVKRQTSPDGMVCYGRPLDTRQIAADLEETDRNVRRHFARLAAGTYAEVRQTPAGPIVRILNAKKQFKASPRAAEPRTELSVAEVRLTEVPPARTEMSVDAPRVAAGEGYEATARTEMSAAVRTERSAGPQPRTEMSANGGLADENVRGHNKDRARVVNKTGKQAIDSREPGQKRPETSIIPSVAIPRRDMGHAETLVPVAAGCGALMDLISPERAFFLETLQRLAPGHDEWLPQLVVQRCRERDPAVGWLEMAALLAVARPDGYKVNGNGFWPEAAANLMGGPVYAALAAARRQGWSRMAIEGHTLPRVRRAMGVIEDFLRAVDRPAERTG